LDRVSGLAGTILASGVEGAMDALNPLGTIESARELVGDGLGILEDLTTSPPNLEQADLIIETTHIDSGVPQAQSNENTNALKSNPISEQSVGNTDLGGFEASFINTPTNSVSLPDSGISGSVHEDSQAITPNKSIDEEELDDYLAGLSILQNSPPVNPNDDLEIVPSDSKALQENPGLDADLQNEDQASSMNKSENSPSSLNEGLGTVPDTDKHQKGILATESTDTKEAQSSNDSGSQGLAHESDLSQSNGLNAIDSDDLESNSPGSISAPDSFLNESENDTPSLNEETNTADGLYNTTNDNPVPPTDQQESSVDLPHIEAEVEPSSFIGLLARYGVIFFLIVTILLAIYNFYVE